jgi:hypothetical protein
MFQFPGSPFTSLFIHGVILNIFQWVSPFGYLRIIGYLRLPEAFRSLSRPSSASGAKAFSVRPFYLDLSFLLWRNCLRSFSLRIQFLLHCAVFKVQRIWDTSSFEVVPISLLRFIISSGTLSKALC